MALIRHDGSFEQNFLQRWFSSVLKCGPIPNHVAFIMDGNRRFASKNQIEKIEGHTKGFDKLAEALKWCIDLSIPEVTVYAFSAENFKRTKEEVDNLMDLARVKFSQILQQKAEIEAHQIRICIVGELHLLPPDIRDLAKELVSTSKQPSKCKLNVCVSYTSRHEMAQALRDITWGLKENYLESDDITQTLIDRTLPISRCDLLIRTSGEVRLSDFLLWQASFSLLSFVKSLWPDFSIWEFYASILEYQQSYKDIKKAVEIVDCDSNISSQQKQRMENFLTKLTAKREQLIETGFVSPEISS